MNETRHRDMGIDAVLQTTVDFLRRSPNVRYAEVRFVSEKTERLSIRDLRPEQVTTGSSHGVGIRVLGSRAWGFACSAQLTQGALENAARCAIELAEAAGRAADSAVKFPPSSATAGTFTTPFAIDPFSVSLDEKLGVLDAPVRALLSRGKPIHSAEAWMEWTRIHKHLLTTEGTDTRQTFTYGSCGMHAFAVDDKGHAQRRSYPTWQGGEGFQGGYECIQALHLPDHVDSLRDEAVALLAAPACPAGTRDLLLESSQVALQIHESCGHPTELDRALGTEITLAGGSFLQPSLLERFQYGSKIVNLVADATSIGGMGTFGWDDEGVAGGRHPLVREGIFVDYLSNREMAATLGRASTGTMRADGWNRTPLIRMVNVSLDPQHGSLDDLIADTKDGILMATDKSWSIDDIRLNFQFSCEIAWEIKRGKRTRILRDPFYTGTTPQFWRSCDAICGPSEWKLWGISTCGKGDPMQSMQVGHGASPARFRSTTIGNSGKA